MRFLVLLQLFILLPVLAQAETWGDLGEPTTLNTEQAFNAFVQGACKNLKASTNKPGDAWYVQIDSDGPAKLMAQDLNDAVFIRVCNAVWSGEKPPLDSVSYIGPFQSEATAGTEDLLTKYGKLFAESAVSAYVNALVATGCEGATPESNDDALRSESCGQALYQQEAIISYLSPECDSGNVGDDACQLVKSAKVENDTLRRKREVLLSVVSNKQSTVSEIQSVEGILLNDVWVRIGDDPLPVILKDKNDCTLSGQVTATEIGKSLVSITERTCNIDGNPISRTVDYTKVVPSKTANNSATGERINTIPSGIKITFDTE